MNLEYKSLLDEQFHPSSKVWVYQCNRVFTLGEAIEVEDLLKEFVLQWKSHGEAVKGSAHLFFGQFIVLMADESATMVGGCSTDSSVRLIKEIEKKFSVNMFDRTTLAFIIKDKVQLLPLSQFAYAIENGFVDGETLYFNNLVQTKEELLDKWIIPIRASWLKDRLNLKVV
ncbi:MAG TPA: hypothetical protein VFO70_06855 [Chitinophagaceae bacterium]|nr:hypothetical protein [Chitinophagaceae bacterium]